MTREIFLLILVFSLCTAFSDPPLDDVAQHNQDVASGMMGNSGIGLGELTKTDPARVNMTIVTVIPVVDGRIPPETVGVMWAWNEKNADGLELMHEGADGCMDRYYPTLINMTVHVELKSTFRNATDSVVVSPSDTIVDIPTSTAVLRTANGTENITIGLEWDYNYYFEVVWTNNVLVEDSCQSEEMTPMQYWDRNVEGSTSAQFIVEPGNASFFLVRPALGEQWYRNNRFDTAVFSRKALYKAEIWMDGNRTAYARMYNFTVVEDVLGAQHIIVNRTVAFDNASMGGRDLGYRADPVVKVNNSFSHIYEVNHSYKGWGPHFLRVTVTDFFGGEHTFGKELLSRKITKEGVSETGEPSGEWEYYRPGIPPAEEERMTHRILPSNQILMVFLVAALWMFWHYRKEGKAR